MKINEENISHFHISAVFQLVKIILIVLVNNNNTAFGEELHC